MNVYRIEIIETRTVFLEVEAENRKQAKQKGECGEGQLTAPYRYGMEAIRVDEVGGMDQ